MPCLVIKESKVQQLLRLHTSWVWQLYKEGTLPHLPCVPLAAGLCGTLYKTAIKSPSCENDHAAVTSVLLTGVS